MERGGGKGRKKGVLESRAVKKAYNKTDGGRERSIFF